MIGLPDFRSHSITGLFENYLLFRSPLYHYPLSVRNIHEQFVELAMGSSNTKLMLRGSGRKFNLVKGSSLRQKKIEKHSLA